MRYYAPESVRMCFTRDTAIFLETKKDLYLSLDSESTRTLSRALSGVSDAETEQLCNELVQRGLLTARGRSARPLFPTETSVPESALLPDGYDDGERPAICMHHCARFAAAWMSVWLSLRFRSIHHAITRIERLNKVKVSWRTDERTEDDLRKLVRVFRYIRPFVYESRDQCLFDSLVLSDFLRRYHISSTCVIGVCTHPFEAHCWVQTDRFVITGSPEFARRYVPLLTV